MGIAQLTSPEPGHAAQAVRHGTSREIQRQHVERTPSGGPCFGQQNSCPLNRQSAIHPIVGSLDLNELRNITRDQLLPHRILQRIAENGVDELNRACGQPKAAVILPSRLPPGKRSVAANHISGIVDWESASIGSPGHRHRHRHRSLSRELGSVRPRGALETLTAVWEHAAAINTDY